MRQTIRKLWRDEEGLSTVEYALLVALIVIVGVAAWQALGHMGSERVIAVDNTVASPC
jgi:Flp pilus assembly pilin Flp